MGGIRGKRDMRNGDLRPGWAGVDTMVGFLVEILRA